MSIDTAFVLLTGMPENYSRSIQSKFEHALNLHKQGNLEQAKRGYRSVLKASRDHPGALHFLGVLTHRQGDSDHAIQLIRKAIKKAPHDSAAHKNLGNVLVELRRYDEAEECYQRAISLQPGEGSNYANLCVVLRHLERYDESIQAGLMSIKLIPDEPLGWYSLGNTYRNAGKLGKAIKYYEKTVALSPRFAPAHDNLCQATFSLEKGSIFGRRRLKRTTRAYRRWLEDDPGNSIATFMLSAIGDEVDLKRAPDDFVRDMFDHFSGSFDQRLAELEYGVPQLIAMTVEKLLVQAAGVLDVLDGGCGTGLCGPILKPYAAHLTGVDLSTGMLAKAKGLRLYDNLVESELTSWLSRHPDAYDMVVFSDTLCYFGDLEDIISATAGALHNDGVVIFSLEQLILENDLRGYRLHPHGRYSHTRRYLEAILVQSEFEVLEIRVETLRLEKGYPVRGLIVSAKKH